MRVLCPSCGFHHEVVRVLDDGAGESRKDVYQVAALGECSRTWISDSDIFDARARFEQDPIVQDDDDV